MSPPSSISIAIWGAGYWGINLIRNFAALPGCRVAMVCEPNQNRWGKIRQLAPEAEIQPSHEAALDRREIQAVVVATPVGTHYRLGLQALEAGKHLFVEKPLAQSGADCMELIAQAKTRGLRLMVGHTFEYNAAVWKAKELIRQGELGKIYYLYSQRLNLGIVRQDINALWSLAPHDVSIIRYLLDEDPVAVSARGYAYLQDAIEDVVYLDLEFKQGIAAHIHVSWLDPGKVRRMTLVGDRKMLVYDDVDTEARIQLFDKGITRANLDVSLGEWSSFKEFQFIQRAGGREVPAIHFEEPLAVECRHFMDCIRNGAAPRTSGENGLRVVRTLEAAELSMKENGRRVALDELDPMVSQ